MNLFITDAELYDLLRLDKVNGPAVVRTLEKQNIMQPFPKPRPPFKHRFFEEVVQWLRMFHRINGTDGLPVVVDGVEDFNARASRKTRRPQHAGAQMESPRDALGRILGGKPRPRPARVEAKDSKVVAFDRSAAGATTITDR